MTDLSGRFSAC